MASELSTVLLANASGFFDLADKCSNSEVIAVLESIDPDLRWDEYTKAMIAVKAALYERVSRWQENVNESVQAKGLAQGPPSKIANKVRDHRRFAS